MGQKGSEFALCLNSANRDVEAHPEPNDFTLDLKDRYLVQGRRPGPRARRRGSRGRARERGRARRDRPSR